MTTPTDIPSVSCSIDTRWPFVAVGPLPGKPAEGGVVPVLHTYLEHVVDRPLWEGAVDTPANPVYGDESWSWWPTKKEGDTGTSEDKTMRDTVEIGRAHV